MNIENLPDGYFNEGDIEAYRKLVSDLDTDGKMLEVGSYKGRSLCSCSDIINANDITVYVVDNFVGAEAFPGDCPDQKELCKEFFKNMTEFSLGVMLSRGNSVEKAEDFKDGCLDLIFIDASHKKDDVIADIRAWLPKLKIGGVIAGHDYKTPDGMQGWDSVKEAVDQELPGSTIMTGSVWMYRKDHE
jgi:cephalosporin hydroxylase